MIEISFLTFAFGVAIGVVFTVMIHQHSHPECPSNRSDRDP